MYCLRSCLNLAFRPIDLVINIYRRNKKLRNKGIHLLVTFIQNDNRIFFYFLGISVRPRPPVSLGENELILKTIKHSQMLISQCLWVFFVFWEKGWKRWVLKSFYTFFTQESYVKRLEISIIVQQKLMV